MAAQEDVWPVDEVEQTLHWRRLAFERLGADPKRAEELAGSGVDYHEVERLLFDGCPLGLAVEILA